MKKTLRILILAALLVATVVAGLETQWRFRAVARKLIGEVPEVSWGQIFSPFSGGEIGFVSYAGKAETGPCASRWTTPVGEIWARPEQEWALELLMVEQLVDKIYDHRKAGVRPGDVVIDVGGHLGTFALFALGRGAERVVVIEPEPGNLDCLKRTFEREIRRGSVALVEAAAWREAGELRFQGNDLLGRIDDQGAVTVRAVTIDQTVTALALDRVDFIKMDIEGAEVDALLGSRETLAKHGPRMALSIYHRPEHLREIRELVLAARPRYRWTDNGDFAYLY